jgi:hypothetical protein
MAEYAFERQFTSPKTPYEVFDEIDDHLIEHLGGKVHYSQARRKYVVQGPSKGIKFGPLMNLKLFFDLRTDNQNRFKIIVKMEKKPSCLLRGLIPIGLLLTLSGIPLFWVPILYFFTTPKADVEVVVDSFIRKMKAPVIAIGRQKVEVYEAIIVERDEEIVTDFTPEGKVYMAPNLKKLMFMSVGIALAGGMIALVAVKLAEGSAPFAMPLACGGGIFMMLGAILLIYILVRMAKNK